MRRAALHTLLVLSTIIPSAAVRAQDAPTTRVAILGVDHSAMLVAEDQRPAVLRAFIGRVEPDAVCIERPPEEFARADHYEFTYEIQDIAVPYAREHGIQLCPFDWIPDVEDQRLAFGIDLEEPPFMRPRQGFGAFLSFTDPATLDRGLFWAEADSIREQYRAWYTRAHETARFDFPRRLFLYRTFMQAKRIARGARRYPGGTVLVIVGAMHKDDLERILTDEPRIEVVPPPEFGLPTPEEVRAEERLADLAAIAAFNLLGVQARTGSVDRDWIGRVVARLRERADGPESRLLETRLRVLTGKMAPADAAEAYGRIREDAGPELPFTWTGVLDRRRLDSFADPFANLGVADRAALEQAREYHRLGRADRAHAIRRRIRVSLSAQKAAQLDAYWPVWVESTEADAES